MTEGLSRREIIACAGAGVAVSSCNFWQAQSTNEALDNNSSLRGTKGSADPFAPCEDYGYPAKTIPNNNSYFPEALEAPYIRIIHVNFKSPWEMWVNHASFWMNGQYEDTDRLEMTKKVLNERFDSTIDPPITRFSEMRTNKTYNEKDEMGFSKFGFRSKHELFFFFESPKVVFDKDWLVVFTKLNMKNPSKPHNENYSFVYSRIVTEAEMGKDLYARGRMFRIRNYVQDEGGQPIDSAKNESRHYGMNIHFKVPSGTNEWVPMVIDPDTGNGAGNEP